MHGIPGTEGVRTQAVVLFRYKILFITKFVFFCCAKGVLWIYTNFFGLATERTGEPCVLTDRLCRLQFFHHRFKDCWFGVLYRNGIKNDLFCGYFGVKW